MTKKEMAANLRLGAAVNRMYERACRETFEKTGRHSALNQAEIHAACAAKKEAQAESMGA